MDSHALIELLAQNGLIQGAEVARLAEIADEESADLFTALEAAGCGGKDEILKSIAEFKELDFLDLRDATIPPQLLKELPPDVMRIYRCFPTFVSVDLCKVCMVDPLDDVARSELSRLLGKSVEVVVADPELVEAMVQTVLEGMGDDSPFVDFKLNERRICSDCFLVVHAGCKIIVIQPVAVRQDFRLPIPHETGKCKRVAVER